MHPDTISFITNCDCFKRILKFTLKQLRRVLVLSPSSGSVQFELAKVRFVKTVGGGGEETAKKKFLWNILNLHHRITQCSGKMESKATATLWKSYLVKEGHILI